MPTRSDITWTTSMVSPEGGAYMVLYTLDNAAHNSFEVACLTAVGGSTNINTNEYVPEGWSLIPIVFYWKIS